MTRERDIARRAASLVGLAAPVHVRELRGAARFRRDIRTSAQLERAGTYTGRDPFSGAHSIALAPRDAAAPMTAARIFTICHEIAHARDAETFASPTAFRAAYALAIARDGYAASTFERSANLTGARLAARIAAELENENGADGAPSERDNR